MKKILILGNNKKINNRTSALAYSPKELIFSFRTVLCHSESLLVEPSEQSLANKLKFVPTLKQAIFLMAIEIMSITLRS
jgi:hypothetical protein